MAKSQLQWTRSYSAFEQHEHNRGIKDDRLLEQSMRRHGFMPSSPIQCVKTPSGRLRVIRGHHRLDVAKRLNLAVCYVVDDSNTDLWLLEGNTHQAWTAQDHLISRARAGEAAYVALREFMARHKLSIGAAASLVGGQSATSNNLIRDIRQGTFRVGSMEHAEIVVSITDLCRQLGLKFASSTPFVGAVSAAVRVPELNADQLRRRIIAHPKELHRRSRREDYLEELEAVYNYASRSGRLPLKHRALEVMLERKKGGWRQPAQVKQSSKATKRIDSAEQRMAP